MDEKRNLGAQAVVGVALIAVGALLIAVRYFGVDPALWGRTVLSNVAWDVVWPFFILGFGTLLLGIGLVDEHLAFSLVPGSMVIATGLILLLQNSLGLWETWAYAWTLVVPTSVGVGLWLWGIRADRPSLRRGGRIAFLTGLVMFGVFALLMEGVFGIGALQSYGLRAYLLPVLLIIAGLLILVPWGRRGKPAPVEQAPPEQPVATGYEPPPSTPRWPTGERGASSEEPQTEPPPSEGSAPNGQRDEAGGE